MGVTVGASLRWGLGIWAESRTGVSLGTMLALPSVSRVKEVESICKVLFFEKSKSKVLDFSAKLLVCVVNYRFGFPKRKSTIVRFTL